MNYSEVEVRRQIRLGEDSLREFKKIKLTGGRLESPKRDVLADEIAAFANTKGGYCCAVSPIRVRCRAYLATNSSGWIP